MAEYDEQGNLIEEQEPLELEQPEQQEPEEPQEPETPPVAARVPAPAAQTQQQAQQPQNRQFPAAPSVDLSDDEAQEFAANLYTDPAAAAKKLFARLGEKQEKVRQHYENVTARESYDRATSDADKLAARERMVLAQVPLHMRGTQEANANARKVAIGYEIAESNDPVETMQRLLAHLQGTQIDAAPAKPAPAPAKPRNDDGTFAQTGGAQVIPPANRMSGGGSVNPRGTQRVAAAASKAAGNGSAMSALESMYGLPGGSLPDKDDLA